MAKTDGVDTETERRGAVIVRALELPGSHPKPAARDQEESSHTDQGWDEEEQVIKKRGHVGLLINQA